MMVLCRPNETKKSALCLVDSVHSQTQTIPEDYDTDINYHDRENLSKKALNIIVKDYKCIVLSQ